MNLLPHLLHMSLSASAVIGIVLAARLALKRAPKWITCLLWMVVLFRLLCPVSLESPVSLVPALPALRASALDAMLPGIVFYSSYDTPLQKQIVSQLGQLSPTSAYITCQAPASLWLSAIYAFGVLAMLLWGLISYLRLRRKLTGAIRLEQNLWLADRIASPFVLGLFRPRIYLCSSLSQEEQRLVLLHEQAHLRGRDQVWKLLAYLALCLHWFNPLVWLAFILSSRDLELRCDEAVLKALGPEIRADYAAALLRFATGRRIPTALAFGEGSPKSRIRNLSRWKQAAPWVIAVSVALCVAVLGLCAFDRRSTEPDLSGLSYKNAANLAAQTQTLPFIYYPKSEEEGLALIQPGQVDGQRLYDYLSSVQWTERRFTPRTPPSPGSLEFCIRDDYRVTIYGYPWLAKVTLGDEVRWYRTALGDYKEALGLLLPEDTTAK